MNRILKAAGSLAIATLIAAPAAAQWPTYPTRGVPLNADGTPNLDAPPPRTADGKIDFTGVWEAGRGGFGGGRGRAAGPGGAGPGGAGPGAAPGGPGARGAAGPGAAGPGGPAVAGPNAAGAGAGPPGAPGGGFGRAGGPGGPGGRRGGGPPADGSPPVASFANVGAGLEGGTAPFTEWGRATYDARVADNMKDNPDAHCLPIGHMQLHLHPQPRKMVQTPDLIVMYYEANYGLREIFLDGRPSPDNDPQPWWYGYSVGKWEGDELVVTTTHFRDGGWLDVNGSPLTDQGKIIERFRRPTFGRLEIDVTIEDPKAYTKPFTVRVNQRILLNEQLIEFICNENEASSEHFDE